MAYNIQMNHFALNPIIFVKRLNVPINRLFHHFLEKFRQHGIVMEEAVVYEFGLLSVTNKKEVKNRIQTKSKLKQDTKNLHSKRNISTNETLEGEKEIKELLHKKATEG